MIVPPWGRRLQTCFCNQGTIYIIIAYFVIFCNSVHYFTDMKLIIAQGNPGSKFDRTRHNIGFAIADAFANQTGTSFKPTSKFFADIAETSVDGEKVIIAKPSTFYNETGQSFN